MSATERKTAGPAADQAATIDFNLDGTPMTAHAGETILQAARRHGVEIPHLCWSDGLRPDDNCRACAGHGGLIR